uniref:Uncharacterized protein n=1 Tax=Anguilla anguilla TaxID=7936 RepID=A0A0E9Q1M4_ANGAN
MLLLSCLMLYQPHSGCG